MTGSQRQVLGDEDTVAPQFVPQPRPNLADLLASGRFLVTTEESPPKGADLTGLLRRTARLVGVVDAVNITESSAAVMTLSPAGLLPPLIRQGLLPVLQITCRDRNRIALQAELLAAAALGGTAVVCMTGDPIEGGDHPEARAVHDLDTLGLLRAAAGLNAGTDSAGNELQGTPRLCIGAVANPGAVDLDREIAYMKAKVDAGACFFQTQAVYDPAAFERFMSRAAGLGVPVLAGFIVPKSGDMARRMNRTVPGVRIPEDWAARLDEAEDRVACSIALSGRLLAALAPMCAGLHVIAVGWEQHLPALLEAAGVVRTM